MRYLKSIALAVLFTLSLAPSALAHSNSVGAPVDLTIASGRYTNDSTPTFTWIAGEGATWYEVKIDNGSYRGIGNVFKYTSTELKDGWHTFYLRSHDNWENVSGVKSIAFEIDTVGLTIGKPSAAELYENESATISATTNGDAQALACTLIIKEGKNTTDVKMKPEAKNAHRFTATYKFKNDGQFPAYVWCIDGDRNSATGPTVTLKVLPERSNDDESNDDEDDIHRGQVKNGDLIKLQCGPGAIGDHPCKSVYYVGDDGKRHPFLNESVYYSWYANFNQVKLVTAAKMSDLSLGETVLYRPGSVLVKFATAPEIYAIGEKSELRAYEKESLVVGDYGSKWKNKIVTVSEQLISVFKIGSVIDSDNDFDPEDVFDEKHDWIDDTFDGR
jgi:hypothetical protein